MNLQQHKQCNKCDKLFFSRRRWLCSVRGFRHPLARFPLPRLAYSAEKPEGAMQQFASIRFFPEQTPLIRVLC
jgi:hypothetical protein